LDELKTPITYSNT